MVEPKNTHLAHHKNREFGSKGKESKGTQVQLTRRGKVHIACDESDHDSDDNTTGYSTCMYHLNEDNRKREPYRVSLSLNEEDISLELDTRARKTVTSEFSP